MSKGKVKYFNDLKGFGFISADEPDQDIYFHYTAIDMSGYKTVSEGQEVYYELTKTDQGLQAARVTPTGSI
jgi:CspA family cold shock protein